MNEEVTKMGGKTYIELEIYHKCLDESYKGVIAVQNAPPPQKKKII